MGKSESRKKQEPKKESELGRAENVCVTFHQNTTLVIRSAFSMPSTVLNALYVKREGKEIGIEDDGGWQVWEQQWTHF